MGTFTENTLTKLFVQTVENSLFGTLGHVKLWLEDNLNSDYIGHV